MTLPFVADSPVQAVADTTTVDLTVAGNVLSAAVVISPNAGNQLSNVGNGLFTSAAISIVGCPPQVGLIPGKTYLISGLSQGTLGTFSVIAVALSATQLGSTVQVFPISAPAASRGWLGIINWTTCLLSFLHDNVNNQIEGTANISAFPWFSVAVDNYISADSTVTFGIGWLGDFTGNRISGASNFTGTAITAGNRFVENLIVNANVVINSSGPPVAVVGNSFLSGASLSIIKTLGTVDINNTVIENNHVLDIGRGAIIIDNSALNGGSITIPGSLTGIVLLANVTLFNGDITVDGVKGLWQLQSSFIGPNGNLFAIGADPGPVTITNLRLDTQLETGGVSGSLTMLNVEIHSPEINRLEFNGSVDDHVVQHIYVGPSSSIDFSVTSLLTLQDIFLAHDGILTNGGPAAGALTEAIYVEVGTLSTAGFMAQRLRLQDETSTLIANTADAIKSGYVNALP